MEEISVYVRRISGEMVEMVRVTKGEVGVKSNARNLKKRK